MARKSSSANLLDKSFLDFFSSLGTKFLNLNLITKVVILFTVVILKNDVNVLTSNIKGAYLPAANALPMPLGYFSESLGNLILVRIFQISTVDAWIILHTLIILTFLILLVLILRKIDSNGQGILLLLIFTTPGLSAVLQTIGSYDSFTFFGGVLFVILNSPLGTFFATLMMTLGNPEQAILAFLALYVLTCIPNFEDYRKRCNIALSFSLIFWFIIQCWMFFNDVPTTRIILIPNFIDLAVKKFWNNPMGAAWSYLGIFWFVVLFCLFHFAKRYRKYFLTSIIFIPLFATLLTADGPRVYALINVPALFVSTLWFWKGFISSKIQNTLIGVYLTCYLLVPTGLTEKRLIGGYLSDALSNQASIIGKFVVTAGQNLFS